MTIFRANNQVKDFTPETAKLVFPVEAVLALEQMIRNPTLALPVGEEAQPESAPQYEK